ncbi:MAG TPA: LysR family transcriptional regulator [Solirubrobacteraceae bacterium]|nr:LysR family transcriptional regulator [Solirubrobacteraceae bacterium]
MTLQQLTYFLAALEHGSFSAAADALHMAQPSLSEQIRRLEDELGVALFVRANRGLRPTDAGRSLVGPAHAALSAAEAARDAVREVRELRGGTAELGLFGLPPPALVSEVLAAFRARHPAVRVRLVGQNSQEVATAVREGDLEAGMVILPVDARGLDIRPAGRDEVLYVSAEPRRLARPPRIEDVAERPFVLYDARHGAADPTRRVLGERAQAAGVRIDPVIEVEDLYAALRVAQGGLADTYAARKHVLTSRFPRRLGAVPFAEPLAEPYGVITRHGARLSPGTRELLALVEERLEALHERLEGRELPRAAA